MPLAYAGGSGYVLVSLRAYAVAFFAGYVLVSLRAYAVASFAGYVLVSLRAYAVAFSPAMCSFHCAHTPSSVPIAVGDTAR